MKKNIFDLLLFILIFIIVLSIILVKPLNDLDEIWNYSFARNIANGLIPYKDFNMVITPFLSIICGIILKLIGDELIVMRILAALLHSTIFYIIYKIFNILNVKKIISIIFAFSIGCLFYDCYCIDYNYFVLLLCLGIMYKEIKIYKEDNNFLKQNNINDLILGILAGLAVTTKQTIGIFICIALLGNKLLFVRTKDEFRTYLKIFINRLIGVVIPIVLMIFYLLFNGAFKSFISYTVEGISSFNNYIPYNNLLHLKFTGKLSILVPIAFLYAWIKTICLEKDKITYIFLVYGLAMFVVCFPISDRIHFLIGAVPTIILIIYELYNLLNKVCKKFIKESYLRFIIRLLLFFCIIIILIFTYRSCFCCYMVMKDANYSTLNHYKYIPIDKELEKQIINVNQYINLENKDIKILDATAAIYMIPLEKYNKDYDMFNKGNFGKDGEERLINEIADSTDTQYFILKDEYQKNWQTPIDIIDFVKENRTQIGEIEIFNIYE